MLTNYIVKMGRLKVDLIPGARYEPLLALYDHSGRSLISPDELRSGVVFSFLRPKEGFPQGTVFEFCKTQVDTLGKEIGYLGTVFLTRAQVVHLIKIA